MKTPVWLIAVAGVFFFTAQAQAQQTAGALYADEYQTCNTGQTKSTVECVDALTKKWNERLNAAYKIAMNKFPAKKRDGMQAVQRLWLQYRDANCRWYSDGEGTIARIEAAECMRSLTAARALELEWAIEN